MGLFNRQPDDEDRARAVPANTPRAITASAQRMRLDDKDEIDRFKQRKSADMWQTDAWEYFDAIGEIKYSGGLIGAVLSRVRLYPGYNVNPDQAPSHVTAAATQDEVTLPDTFANDCARVLQRLQTANGGISGILNRAGVNIWVSGECYLVQTPAKQGSGLPERWDIKSVDELVVGQDKTLSVKATRTSRPTKADELPPSAFVGRIWRSHPRYSGEADSSLRAIRDLADELLLLNRSARATIRSRLNAGAMYLPDGLSLAADADEDDQLDPNSAEIMADPPEEEDPFEQEFMDALTTPISDEESVAAVVPLIIRGPAELGDKIKQFKFERSFDPEMTARADTILTRIMHGLDIPKDVVTGMANVKYSNAVQTDETLYKAHIEPLILLICDALTEVYYRPALIALGHPIENVQKALIWYDPSDILTHPNKAQSANDGYDRRAVSGRAWRKAHGYAETDAPTNEELAFRILTERAVPPPQLVTELFQLFIPTLLSQAHTNALGPDNPAGALSPDAQDVIDGQPESPDGATPQPTQQAPNPATQPPAPPGPGTPTTPVSQNPTPASPTSAGMR